MVSVRRPVFAADLVAMVKPTTHGYTAAALATIAAAAGLQGFFTTQGVITTKAALGLLGLPGGPVRAPLVDATADEVAALRVALTAAGADMTALRQTAG